VLGALGTELGFGAGPLDLLAADPQGRLVIVEFKRGTENPDVRKVVAQVLDYGASLWRTSYDEAGRRCAGEDRPSAPDLAAIAAAGCALLDVRHRGFRSSRPAVRARGSARTQYSAIEDRRLQR
jgi:hypothetical protein